MGQWDPEGHYAALNLEQDSSQEEIHLSYRLLKEAYRERREGLNIRRVQVAYETLSDMESRAEYDRGGRQVRPAAREPKSSGWRSPLVLALVLLMLAAVLIVTQGPAMMASWVSFEPGDQLYLEDGGAFLGTVSAYERAHLFHNGAEAPAYLLQPGGGAAGIWYPARDLARISRRR